MLSVKIIVPIVGIGTTSPTLLFGSPGLHVSNSTGGSIRFERTGATATTFEAGVYSGAFGITEITGGSQERFTIKAGGNVGIGTTSPAGTFDIRGGTATDPGGGVNVAGANIYLYAQNASQGAGGNSINGGNIILMPGTSRGSSVSGVGIGTTNPSAALEVNGDVKISGSTFTTVVYQPSGVSPAAFDLTTLSDGAYQLLVEVWYGGALANVQYSGLYLFQKRAGNSSSVRTILAFDGPGNNEGAASVTTTSASISWGGNRAGRISILKLSN